MSIIVSKYAGFCYGVKNAIETATDALSTGKRVFSFGELIHNEAVVADLERKGISVIQSTDEAQSGDLVVVRAHGVAPSTIDALRQRGAQVLDATCPFVKKIHGIVEKAASDGKQVLIVGDEQHPEVRGIVGYAGSEAAVVDLNFDGQLQLKPSVLVVQTTFSGETLKKILKKPQISQLIDLNLLEIFDTICYTTKGRREELLKYAPDAQAVLVVGSKSSANTRRLQELASTHCDRSFIIENIGDLESLYNTYCSSIFITAGASTPQWLVEEVKKTMSENLENTNSGNEEVSENPIVTEEQTTIAANKEEFTMEDVIAGGKVQGYTSYKEGNRVKCTVEHVKEEGLYVSIGGKKDGFIDKTEVSLDGYDTEAFKDGDNFYAVILDARGKEYITLSKKKVEEREKLDKETEEAINSKEFEVKIEKVEKGGLTGRIGHFSVFIPASQIRMGFVRNLEEYVGKTLKVRALPPKVKEGEEDAASEDAPKRRRRNIVASARIILEEEKKARDDEFWGSIHVNDIVVGRVKRFTAFGAFVSVKGFDCLAHISELSWNKISDPSSVLKINETYEFVVLKIDRAEERISLGYKQLQKKPYEVAAEKYPIGTVIKGKVERIFPFGAFIFIEDGVDGLVHVSQISHNWVKDANEVLKVGDDVDAQIIGFEDNRITLSIKALTEAPAAPATEENAEEAEGAAKPKRTNSRFSAAKKSTDSSEKAPRRGRQPKDNPDELREWHSEGSTGGATIGDRLGGLLFEIPADDDTDDSDKK